MRERKRTRLRKSLSISDWGDDMAQLERVEYQAYEVAVDVFSSAPHWVKCYGTVRCKRYGDDVEYNRDQLIQLMLWNGYYIFSDAYNVLDFREAGDEILVFVVSDRGSELIYRLKELKSREIEDDDLLWFQST